MDLFKICKKKDGLLWENMKNIEWLSRENEGNKRGIF